MNKSELNNKLAELYGIEKLRISFEDDGERPAPIIVKILLIDDWSRLMDLAVHERLNIYMNLDIVTCTNDKDVVEISEFMSDHESPQAATKYAIAMALVRVNESK